MNRFVSWIVFPLMVTASTVWAESSPWEKKLPFETATVTYALSGTMSGSKTIYVKNFGRTSAEYSETTMKMFGMTQKQQEVIITTPEWVYTADLVDKTGSKQVNPKKFMIDEFNSLSKGDRGKVIDNIKTMGVALVQGASGKVSKSAATILGYPCDRVSLMGTTAYNISGTELPLKIEGDIMGIKIQQVATEVATGKAPASKFELPQGIRFEANAEADRMAKSQAHALLRGLLEGKISTGENTMPNETNNTSADEPSEEEIRKGVQNVLKNLLE